jgi:hypothetical protein
MTLAAAPSSEGADEENGEPDDDLPAVAASGAVNGRSPER